jgi:hypothetical protein
LAHTVALPTALGTYSCTTDSTWHIQLHYRQHLAHTCNRSYLRHLSSPHEQGFWSLTTKNCKNNTLKFPVISCIALAGFFFRHKNQKDAVKINSFTNTKLISVEESISIYVVKFKISESAPVKLAAVNSVCT